MKNILIITLLIFLLSVSSIAQSPKPGEPETKYDKFKDKTTVTVVIQLSKTLIIGGVLIEDLSLTLATSFNGRKPPSEPKDITSFFLSVNTRKRYSFSHSWIILADEERVKLGDGEYEGTASGAKVAELIFYSMSRENLKKVANAKKIEMQLGDTAFTLTESQVKNLKDFYKEITLQPELNKANPQPPSTSTTNTKEATESANSLPTNFKGQDADFIFDQLLERQKGLVKSEFESTPEFEKRSSEELKKPITSNLGLKDTFAFVMNNVKATYDADSKVMSMFLDTDKGAFDTHDRNLYSIRWFHEYHKENRYYIDSYDLLFERFGGLFPSNSNISSSQIAVGIALEAEEAKRLKTSIRAIAFVKFEDPYAKYDTLKVESHTGRKFYVSLVDIYFYDPQSGKVFAKASEMKRYNP
jgi:hypothetical protein